MANVIEAVSAMGMPDLIEDPDMEFLGTNKGTVFVNITGWFAVGTLGLEGALDFADGYFGRDMKTIRRALAEKTGVEEAVLEHLEALEKTGCLADDFVLLLRKGINLSVQ